MIISLGSLGHFEIVIVEVTDASGNTYYLDDYIYDFVCIPITLWRKYQQRKLEYSNRMRRMETFVVLRTVLPEAVIRENILKFL
jgi:hypothetical protein